MGYLKNERTYTYLICALFFVLLGCRSDEGDPCVGYNAFRPLRPDARIDVYAEQPIVRYLLTRANGVDDTLVFATRLDTVYTNYSWTDVGFDCGWCSSVFEIVELHFEPQGHEFDMEVWFTPCVEYVAEVNGSKYVVDYEKPNDHVFGPDSLKINDSLGLYYFAKDSQYQLTLLP